MSEGAMIDAPQIVQTSAVQVAAIHLTVPREQVREVMGPGLQEVRAALARQGLAAAGPWLTHHLSFPPGQFDFEICVPVPRPVLAEGRVRAGLLPAGRVARTLHRGSFEGLGAAWGELDAWIAAQGLKAATHLWEVYLAGPEASPDPASWRTELNRPLL
jgi:effector-binding domain-containing protein